jgi:hypothetical protein
MESLLTWIGVASGALVVVAVAVAWWEHLARVARPEVPPQPALPRAATVDVSLDALAASPAGDTLTRRAALDGAIGRMAWTDTRPMVQPGSTPSPEPAPAPAAQG